MPVWEPRFPAAWMVPYAAASVRDAAGGPVPGSGPVLREGPQCYLVVSPGSIRIMRTDLARAERAVEVGHKRRGLTVAQSVIAMQSVDQAAAALALLDGDMIELDDRDVGLERVLLDPLAPQASRSRIAEWSRKSRRNMTERFTTLDYAPLVEGGRLLAMGTATLPDDWEGIAPTGAAFKRLMFMFRRRYARAWGEPLRALWKLEFQGRGAPHLHFLLAPPLGRAKDGLTWRDWYPQAWADVLGVTGETRAKVVSVHSSPLASADYSQGLRCTDPARIAIYFLKHGLLSGKEYQHEVPLLWQEPGAGPGRFWGYWGLSPELATAPLTFDQAVELSRVARKIAQSHRPMRVATVQRVDTATGLVGSRHVRRRARYMSRTFGFLAANDGPALALALASSMALPAESAVSPLRRLLEEFHASR